MIDLKKAICTMEFDGGEIGIFMDAERPVGVARTKGDYLIDLCIPDYISSETLNKEVVKDGGQISPVVGMGN